jgi:hypothetical protein
MPITEFKIKQHSYRSTPLIEVWYDGKFRATITPGDENQAAMRVSTTHLRGVDKVVGSVVDIYQFNFFED